MATKREEPKEAAPKEAPAPEGVVMTEALQAELDRKSTRLNSSHT